MATIGSVNVNLAETGEQIAYMTTNPSSLSNFPVLINLSSDPNLIAHAQSGGNDIVFTDSTGENLLPYEIESYSAGNLVAWVDISSLSLTNDSIIYMYYGNPVAASQAAPTSVWDTNYQGVWHFGEGSGTTAHDSTTNGQTGTLNNTPSWVTGQIGNALRYSGSNSVTATLGSDPGNTNTVESWLYPTTSVNAGTATVTHDVDASNTCTNCSTLTWNHPTGSQSNRILFVGVVTTNSSAPTSVTYNGTGLTKITSITINSAANNSFWYLVNPVAGTNSVQVNGSSNIVGGGSSTYYNVNQSTPMGTFATNTGSSTGPSVPVTSNTSQLVVDNVVFQDGQTSVTPGSGQTQTYKPIILGDQFLTASYKTGLASSTTMSWTVGATTAWGDIGVPLNGAPTTPTVLTNIGDPSLVLNYGSCIATASAMPLNTWTDLAAVSNGSGGCSIYQNGRLTQTGTTGVDFGTNLNIGESSFIGTIDETRISNTVRTAGWIQTGYNNQSSPTSFYSVESSPETDIYAPTLSQLLRHGEFFGTQGVESGIRQPFTF